MSEQTEKLIPLVKWCPLSFRIMRCRLFLFSIQMLLFVSPVLSQEKRIVIPDSLLNKPVLTSKIEFVEREYDFGDFCATGADTLKNHTFTFVNKGQKPLVVLRAVSSCGCTQPTHTKDPVMPGDSGTVTVGYRGAGQLPGYFRKSVTVYSNDPRSYVRIFIRGQLLVNKGKE